MDFSIPLVFVILFIMACLSLVAVYKYGMRGKSYEEALAEQRQQTHALLGTKAKPKEKKHKKPSKKQSKEQKVKQSMSQEHESDESEITESNASETNHKIHVDFKEEPEEVPIKEVVQVPVKPKRVKKMRPILIKKEKTPDNVILDLIETPIANHFEENPPKDDLEIKRSNSKEDILKQNVKDKNTKEKKPISEIVPPVRTNKKQQKQITNSSMIPESNGVPPVKEKEIEEKTVEPEMTAPLTNGIIGNPGKEKKKKKSEYNTLQQLTAERDGLINSVRKAELSKNEIQLLIDLLLNKQLEAPAVIDEWSEGKSDPVQKLKKQLAEKEKALAEEKEALVSAQAKLREVRAEQQGERIQLQQKIRALDEILQNKQIEMQAANNRAQVSTQNIQQLQNELNNEAMKVRKFMEDNAALQIQIQQMKENDTVPSLRNDLEELSTQNQQLLIERQQILREKDLQHQQFLVQLREMEKNFEQTDDVNQQLKKSKQMLEMERTNLKAAVQQHYDEKVDIEHRLRQKLDELRDSNNEKLESLKIIAQLESELKILQEQLTDTSGALEDKKSHEVRILNLNNELSCVTSELNSMRAELQKTENKYKSELDSHSKIRDGLQQELDEQKAKNNELRTKNWKVIEALNAAEKRSKGSTNANDSQANDNLASEIQSKEQEAQKQFVLRLFPEIEDLKSVPSEHWQEQVYSLIRNYIISLQTSQNQPKPPTSPQKAVDVSKLQAQIQYYKNIIDETEGMLNNLQLHVEKEEINWRNQLAAKDNEIEQIKETRSNAKAVVVDTPERTPDIQGVQFAYKCIEKSLPVIVDELENKVASLEQQLIQTLEEKRRIQEELQLLKSNSQKLQSSNKYSDPMVTIEQLSEEISRLKEQLRVEQNKNGDVNICLKTQNFTNSRNGPALIEVPTIRNPNICSNMGCQFLYCDGNTCQGNS